MTATFNSKRMTASAEAALHIRRLIFEGKLQPGDTVAPAKIGADLGISRIPVREAIVALEREGLLTVIPHRGAFVAAMDKEAVQDHFELFGLVYGLAAKRTAERATPQVVAKLSEAQSALAGATDPVEVLTRTHDFNDIILAVGGSPRVRAIASTMSGLLPGNMFELIPGTIPGEKRGTANVLKAVRNGDGEAAFNAWRAMMRGHGEQAQSYLAKQRLL